MKCPFVIAMLACICQIGCAGNRYDVESKPSNYWDEQLSRAVPVNLETAIRILRGSLSETALNKFLIMDREDLWELHYGLGRLIRNYWLTSQDTIFYKSLLSIGLNEADEMSGYIIDCLWHDVQGKPIPSVGNHRDFVDNWLKQEEAKMQ